MVNFGLYLVTGHPLHHNITIRFPMNKEEPVGHCTDCHVDVDVRFIHPGWLDITSLVLEVDGIDGEDNDPATTAYAKGMVAHINKAISNYSRAVEAKKWVQPEKKGLARIRTTEQRIHCDYARQVMSEMVEATTAQAFKRYEEMARKNSLEPKGYRHFHNMLNILQEEGLLESELLGLGRGGVKRIFRFRDNGKI